MSLVPSVVRYTLPFAGQYAKRPATSHGVDRIPTNEAGEGGTTGGADAAGGAAIGTVKMRGLPLSFVTLSAAGPRNGCSAGP